MSGFVFFTQQRVGHYGKLFTIAKFSTMWVNHGGTNISVQDETRIIPWAKHCLI
jgi:lipopolysaccharide/colanic/teichoic acid biosynthesis glycosyltransferase